MCEQTCQMENVKRDLLDVDLMEAVAIFQTLAVGIVQGLHDEIEQAVMCAKGFVSENLY